MLRVLHVLDSLHVGGSEWQCLSLATRLDPARFESHVVGFGGGGLQGALEASGVARDIMPFRGLRSAAGLRDLIRLSAWIRRGRFDIVQSYGFYSNVPAAFASRLARGPRLVTSRRDMGEFMGRSQRLLERVVFRLADRIVVNADVIRRSLVATGQAPARKIALVPSGVDLARFDALGAGGPRPPWARGGKVVTMVAMFREAKDHRTLLHAASRVLRVEPDVVFVVAGGVPAGSAICEALRRDAEQLAKDLGIAPSVRFLGTTAPEALPTLLRQVDVGVLASTRFEGMPNSVLEYMAAGKPAVVTDAGGCREIVVDGTTGFVVPLRNPESLGDRILQLVQDDGLAARLGKAGRERVESEFSLTSMARRFSDLYETVAQPRGRRPTEALA